MNFHLYQQYDLFKNFQLYHQFDQGKQVNLFSDFNENNVGGGDYQDYYDQFLIDSDSTYQKSTFRTLSNEIGLIGKLSSIFYRFMLKTELSIIQHYTLIRCQEEWKITWEVGLILDGKTFRNTRIRRAHANG